MSPRLLALAAAALVAAAAPQAQTGTTHTFQVHDGAVYLDSRLLPDAVPEGLDLSGMATGVLEFSGPVTPVIQVDGDVYVLQNERLVPLEESGQPEESVYILGDVAPSVLVNLSEERIIPIVEEAYRREVADLDRSLYQKMREVQRMDAEALLLAARVRAAPEGERGRLRDTLRRLLSDALVLKHEVKAEEIALVEVRLRALRQRLAEREGQHDAIVDHRLRELTGN